MLAAMRERFASSMTFLALIALAFTYGMQLAVTADMTAYVSADIAGNFGPSGLAQYAWVSSAWTLGCSVTCLIAGRFSDVFGRRYFFIACNVLALLGSLMGGVANRFSVLIGGTILCGLAGGMANLALAAGAEIVPNKYRAAAIAFLELSIAPFGYFGGNSISRLIIAKSTYKWIYWFGVLQSAIGLALCFFFYFPPSHPINNGKTRLQEVKDIDWIGLALWSGGLSTFLIGVIYGSGLYDWTDIHTYLPTVLGFLTLVVFIFWERKVGDNALCPPRLFRNNWRGFTNSVVVAFVAGMVFFSGVVLWPGQVALFYTDDPLMVGPLVLTQGAGILLGGVVIGGFLVPYLGSTRWQLVVANVIQLVGYGCMAAMTRSSKTAALIVIFIANLPFIWIMNLSYLNVQFSTSEKDIGVATCVATSLRNAGGAIAVAIYVAVLTKKSSTAIPEYITNAARDLGFTGDALSALVPAFVANDAAAISQIPGMTAAAQQTISNASLDGSAYAYRIVYLITIPFSILALVASYYTIDVSHHLKTDHLPVDLSKVRHEKPVPEMEMQQDRAVDAEKGTTELEEDPSRRHVL